jgi:hypothetical protein
MHRHIGVKRRLAGAVHDTRIPDQQIVRHGSSSSSNDVLSIEGGGEPITSEPADPPAPFRIFVGEAKPVWRC